MSFLHIGIPQFPTIQEYYDEIQRCKNEIEEKKMCGAELADQQYKIGMLTVMVESQIKFLESRKLEATVNRLIKDFHL